MTALAATAALALTPLAATTAAPHASPAPSALSAAPSAGGYGTDNSRIWSGYVLRAKPGQRFREVYTHSTVPKLSCAHVLRDYRSTTKH